jgi:hypothetical protein
MELVRDTKSGDNEVFSKKDKYKDLRTEREMTDFIFIVSHVKDLDYLQV